MAVRRAEYFAGKACAQCGSLDRLELDAIWSWSASRRNAELAKCQPLCHDCHKRKTAAENSARMTGRANMSCRRFNESEILMIREALAGGAGVRELGRNLGIHHTAISKINRGVAYREITGKEIRG